MIVVDSYQINLPTQQDYYLNETKSVDKSLFFIILFVKIILLTHYSCTVMIIGHKQEIPEYSKNELLTKKFWKFHIY
jgi:hypothetical protein